MGLFSNQFSSIVEWQETRNDVFFWKWKDTEIKKGSRLIIRPGQDAIFLVNGRIEGIFEDEGEFDIDSQIIPFISSLKNIKYGFSSSGIRTDVIFINTKEVTVKWGTQNSVRIPSDIIKTGVPIRAFGTLQCKITDRINFIDQIAGIREIYTVNDIRELVVSKLDPLLMKWITAEGKDIFNLQSASYEIAEGIKTDLDMELFKIGLSITEFSIQNFSYPEEFEYMMTKNLMRNEDINTVDNNEVGNSLEDGITSDGIKIHKFCPECGTKTIGTKFCGNCGYKLTI